MSLIAQCSACGKRYKLGDDKAGKKIKCQCGKVVAVPLPAGEEADPWDNLDEEMAPVSSTRSLPPVTVGRKSQKPAPKAKSKAKSKGLPIGIVLGILGGVIALGGIGGGVWFFAFREKPANKSDPTTVATTSFSAASTSSASAPGTNGETTGDETTGNSSKKSTASQSTATKSSTVASDNTPAKSAPAAKVVVKVTVEQVKEGNLPKDKISDPNVVLELRGRVQMHTSSSFSGPGFLITNPEQRLDQSGPTIDAFLLDRDKPADQVAKVGQIVTLHAKPFGGSLKECVIIKAEPSPGP